VAGPQLALVLKAEKTANRASHQAAISPVWPIEQDYRTQGHLQWFTKRKCRTLIYARNRTTQANSYYTKTELF